MFQNAPPTLAPPLFSVGLPDNTALVTQNPLTVEVRFLGMSGMNDWVLSERDGSEGSRWASERTTDPTRKARNLRAERTKHGQVNRKDRRLFSDSEGRGNEIPAYVPGADEAPPIWSWRRHPVE
jgi:hypothetical protein